MPTVKKKPAKGSSAKQSSVAVGVPSIAWNSKVEAWRMVDDLLGGTRAMREARTLWLPQEPKESARSYTNRIARSFLYPGLKRALRQIVAKPFSKAPTIDEDGLPDELAPMLEDVDREGCSFAEFSAGTFKASVSHGIAAVLVNHPPAKVDASGAKIARTAKEAAEQRIRPFFVLVSATNLRAAVAGRRADGSSYLAHAKVREVRRERHGNYEVEVAYMNEYDALPDEAGEPTVVRWRLWREEAQGRGGIVTSQRSRALSYASTYGSVGASFVFVSESVLDIDEIPLVPFVPEPIGFFEGEVPLEELADTNVCHWQSYSDQRNLLRVARVPMLSATGVTEDDGLDEGVVASSSTLLRARDPAAKFAYVEPTGGALGAGRTDLLDLQAWMEVLGVQPFVQKEAEGTATGRVIDDSNQQTSIQRWILRHDQAWAKAWALAARWADAEIEEGWAPKTFRSFYVSTQAWAEIETLLKMRAAREITSETFLREVQKRGGLDDTVDVAIEVQAVKDEAEELAAKLGAGDEAGMPPDGEDDAQPKPPAKRAVEKTATAVA